MGIETILLVLGVVLVVSLIGAARGRRRRSPTEPLARDGQPPRVP